MPQHFPANGNVLMTFVTPMLARRWPDSADLNRRLREVILEVERRDQGMERSNAGGWHSKDDLFRWEDPAIAELLQRVMAGTQEITHQVCGETVKGRDAELAVSGWANVSRDRNYNILHNHLRYTWSGVYYVALGESDPAARDSGAIEFLDPRLGIDHDLLPGGGGGPFLRLTPEPGLMLMFPSWLQHWVRPFQGRGERISIAFNVTLKFPD
jgi:hypothetical protein